MPVLGVGAFGDLLAPALTRLAYLEAYPDQVPPFDDRAALFPLPTLARPVVVGLDGQAAVNFAPLDPLFGAARYVVITSPGGTQTVGTDSPIMVLGLLNGADYTFTVTAYNAHGQMSLPSLPSGIVNPHHDDGDTDV